MYPDKFNINVDVRTLKLVEDLAPWTSKNTKSLGEILGGFFNFYANFP
jgi:hypothetical protein